MSENRVTPDVDFDGISIPEAFTILGNDTRLKIVRVLWESGAMHQFDDVDEAASTVPYSELREMVGVRDNGNFNYHLSELRPHFVIKTEDGYRLSGAGKKLTRAVVAVSGESLDFQNEPDIPCPLCDGSVEASYQDSWLRFTCANCDGLFGDAAPSGTLLNENFPPAGVASRDVTAAYQTKLYRCVLDMLYLMSGVCRECASPVDSSVTVCEEHSDTELPCPACGRHSAVWAELRCQACRFAKRLPVEFCVLGLMPTLAFLYENGIDLLDTSLGQLVELAEAHFDVATAGDPLRVEVTIELNGDSLTLVLDDTLNHIGP